VKPSNPFPNWLGLLGAAIKRAFAGIKPPSPARREKATDWWNSPNRTDARMNARNQRQETRRQVNKILRDARQPF